MWKKLMGVFGNPSFWILGYLVSSRCACMVRFRKKLLRDAEKVALLPPFARAILGLKN